MEYVRDLENAIFRDLKLSRDLKLWKKFSLGGNHGGFPPPIYRVPMDLEWYRVMK